MAEAGMLAGYGVNLLNIMLMFGGIILAFMMAGGVAFGFRQYMKWSEYKVIIWRRNGFGELEASTDSAGVFLKKRINAKRLWLKKSNVGLPPDKIPYLTMIGGWFPQKLIFLYQNGLKNFHFIKPSMKNNVPEFSVGEEDVNWAIGTYESSKKSFISNTLLQYLPYISLIVVAVIIMIIFVWFFKNFDVLRDLGVSLEIASKNLAVAKATVV